MGHELRKISVSVSLSRHNDERDERDNQLFERLCLEIEAVCEKDEYRDISPVTY